jgi:hypothetical protein
LQNITVPEIILDFQCESGLLFIVLQNIGIASAYKISVKFDKKIIDKTERNLASMNIFNHLEFIPPGKKFQIFIDSFQSYVARKQPLAIEATITYLNKRRRRFREIIKHDLCIYKDMQEIVK